MPKPISFFDVWAVACVAGGCYWIRLQEARRRAVAEDTLREARERAIAQQFWNRMFAHVSPPILNGTTHAFSSN
jgi:hypothetical protein